MRLEPVAKLSAREKSMILTHPCQNPQAGSAGGGGDILENVGKPPPGRGTSKGRFCATESFTTGSLFYSLLFTITSLPLFSLYNGNPSMPEMPEEGYFISRESWLSIKTGYEGDIIFCRDMELTHHHSHVKEHVKRFESWTNSGTLTFGFNDRGEIYTSLGATGMKIQQTPLPDQHIRYFTNNHFSWLVGIRAIAAYWGDLQLGLDAKYMQTLPDLDSIKVNGSSVPVRDAHVDYREWQVGIGLSYKFRFFIPYFGVKYSDVRAKFKDLKSLAHIFPEKHFSMKNEEPIGLFIGFGLAAERIFALNLEFRFLDETSGTVSADIRF